MRRKIIQAAYWLIAILCCAPFVQLARYSTLWADDFSNWLMYMNCEGSNHLAWSFEYNRFVYHNWQGAYVANFLSVLFHPFWWHDKGMGLSTATRMVNVGIVVLLFVSFYLFLRNASSYIEIKKHEAIVAFSLCLLPLISLSHYGEIFSWYTVVIEYTLSLVFAFLSFSFILNQKRSRTNVIFACLFSFLASGGILAVSGVVTYFALFLLVLYWIENKRPNVINIVYFLTAFLSSLFNALADGNFARHDIIDSQKISLFRGVYYATEVYLQGVYHYIISSSTVVFFFVLVTFAVGFWGKRKVDTRRSVIIIIAMFFWPLVAVYPTVLGYSTGSLFGGIPDRVLFIFNLIFIVSMEVISYLIGIILRNARLFDNKSNFSMLFGIVFVYIIFTRNSPVETQPYFQICDAIFSGDLKENSNSVYDIYFELENSDDDDIVFEAPRLIGWFMISPFSEDTDYWVNVALSKCYNKDSVCFITEGGGSE